MPIHRKILAGILIILILTYILLFFKTKGNIGFENQNYSFQVYEVNQGYGYSIFYNKKIIIKQDIIPVIENKKNFCSYDDAENLAKFVLKKIVRKGNPNVTLKELEKLNISIDCN